MSYDTKEQRKDSGAQGMGRNKISFVNPKGDI
jgi:hypothetical protein